ncbi:MAG TPA: YjzD family protein [Limosilactobacillus coleohominis]|nr:YjzD family protein [Limosilactobacillus coleohominis]
MKKIMGSIMAIIWGGILGMLLGYIGSQLEATSINFLHAAITGAVFAVIATNCVYAITTKANPARQK